MPVNTCLNTLFSGKLTDWVEVNIINTDPTVDDTKLDPDDDKIPTYWEWNWGYNPKSWDDHNMGI